MTSDGCGTTSSPTSNPGSSSSPPSTLLKLGRGSIYMQPHPSFMVSLMSTPSNGFYSAPAPIDPAQAYVLQHYIMGRRHGFSGAFPKARCQHCHRHTQIFKLHIPSKAENNMALLDDLEKRGIYQGYEHYVLGLEPILQQLHIHGMPVNPARHSEVMAELTTRKADAELAM